MMSDLHEPIPNDTQTILEDPCATQKISMDQLRPSSNLFPTFAQEVSMGLDVSKKAFDKLDADHLKILHKIHRFPEGLREFGEERQYIVPKMVAIGPYHRHLLELQKMEEVKQAAAHHLCEGGVDRYEQAYGKVVAVAGDARSCYEASAVQDISDSAFASMMFHDGCFLLLTVLAITKPQLCAPALLSRTGSGKPVVLTDMFLLENQIPWPVLDALNKIFTEVDFIMFITTVGMNVQSRIDREARPLILEEHTPPHLLGLFHFYQSGRAITFVDAARYMSLQKLDDQLPPAGSGFGARRGSCWSAVRLKSLSLGTSAIEMAEIGIKVTISKTAVLKDIGLTKGPLFRSLFLPSLRLNDNTACWLLNMAALESCTDSPERLSNGEYTVSSYLTLLGMLMDREEDVHELRAKQLIHGEFTNKQTLDFFKGRHANNLRTGHHYIAILRELERYKGESRTWIVIHRFIYSNIKIIVAVLSIISVLVGIFKTLLSLKKN